MAEHDRTRQLSLVPYDPTQGEVVLRHGNAVVTYDSPSNGLIYKDSRVEDNDQDACPYCHRPYHDPGRQYSDARPQQTRGRQTPFINPEYFQMLAERPLVSAQPTRASSPSTPLRALRSGDSRNVSGSGTSMRDDFRGSPSTTGERHSIPRSSFSMGYFQRFFTEKKMLGKGGRGVVLLVEHRLDNISCGEFACKRIPVGDDRDGFAKVMVEVQLLKKLHHPNLVTYHYSWLEEAQTTTFGPPVPCLFILQDFCNAGDLQDFVQEALKSGADGRRKPRRRGLSTLITWAADKRQMPLDEIFAFFKDVASGLNHLHTNGYIHRDLKPSNCLLHADEQGVKVLISDFGEVQAVNEVRKSSGATGTLSYCAPEIVRHEAPDGPYSNFTTKSDVFSLGMVLHYMCFGDLPYVNADVKEENEDLDLLRAEIASWRGFEGPSRRRRDLPDRLYQFLEQLLNLDPLKRPSTSEILYSLRHGIEVGDRAGGERVEVVEEAVSSADESTDGFPTRPSQLQLRRRISYGTPSEDRDKEASSPGRDPEIAAPSQVQSPPQSLSPIRSPRLGRRESAIEAMRKIPKIRTAGPDSSLDEDNHSPRTPLLLLPPPPAPVHVQFYDTMVNRSEFRPMVRTIVFLVKFWLLAHYCSPFGPGFWSQNALLAFAAFDMLMLNARLEYSAGLGVIWVMLAIAFQRTDQLCMGPSTLARWDKVP